MWGEVESMWVKYTTDDGKIQGEKLETIDLSR
jgi:hypothetical protein